MLAVMLATASAIVAGWRYFPGFTGDHAWYLQVALRVSQGEVLYRDVAWAYGPLPAQALATLFRWFGPDAAWASLINGVLTLTGIGLTYVVVRSVLSASGAFWVTAFAALVGPNLWGGLFHIYNYTYTQAIAWGAVTSLAALACALRWQQTRRSLWIDLAGLATGLAILSKPEFGLAALGASAAAIVAGRGPAGTWGRYLLASSLTAGIGLGWQAWYAGWRPVWRGYVGYSQVTDRVGALWGTYIGSRSRLLAGYAFWLAVAVIWVNRRWPRRRLAATGVLLLAGLAALAVGLLVVMGGLPESLRQESGGMTLVYRAWSFLSTLPWAPMAPLLLVTAWAARGQSLPPAWWALWAYALLSNLRLLLTGYASGLAVAPALAAFWVVVDSRLAGAPRDRRLMRRAALAVLAALAAIGLVGQVVVPDPLFNGPRVWVDTTLGPLRIAQRAVGRFEAMASFLDRAMPPGAPIFAADYGAQWYLVTNRPNRTAFDVAIAGLGLSGPEAASLERALLAEPPAAVILPAWWQLEANAFQPDAQAMRQNLPTWWQRFREDYVDDTPPGVAPWRVFVRQRHDF
jgi:hypothetical protein